MTELADIPEELVLSYPTAGEVRRNQTLPGRVAQVLQRVIESGTAEGRTPTGDMLVVDMSDLSEGTIVNSHTLKKTGEFDLESDDGNKEFSLVAFATDSLTLETSGTVRKALTLASKRANIQIGKKGREKKVPYASNVPGGPKRYHTETVDIPSMSGKAVVIERKGADSDPTWRIDLMREAGFKRVIVDTGDNEDDPIIWQGSRLRESKRKPIDSTTTAAAPDIAASMERNQQVAEVQGQIANRDELLEDVHNSRMIPNTRARAADGSGVTLQDNTTGDILRYDRQGNEYRSGLASEEEREIHKLTLEDQARERERIRQETLDQRARTQDPKSLSQKDISELLANKKGFARQDLTCPRPECGKHPVDRFTSDPKEIRYWLYITTVCNGSHRDGRPVYFDGCTIEEPYKYRGAYGWVKRSK
jgi:hypothetical protein